MSCYGAPVADRESADNQTDEQAARRDALLLKLLETPRPRSRARSASVAR